MVVKTVLRLIDKPVKPVISLPIQKYPNNEITTDFYEITTNFASNASQSCSLKGANGCIQIPKSTKSPYF